MEDFLRLIAGKRSLCELKRQVKADPGLSAIYPASIHEVDGTVLFIKKTEDGKKLVAAGGGSKVFVELKGEERVQAGLAVKECDLTVENSKVIRKYFPFTNPVPLSPFDATIGLGDRLGLASPGHIRLIKNYKVRPVLAQQSIRELNLTGRDYPGVLADAVWAVFQEDYRGGFGADGDHLKSMDEVRMALDCGFTMITLDCSEYIKNLPSDAAGEEVDRFYGELDQDERKRLEMYFLGRSFPVSPGLTLSFSPESLRYNAVVYQKAVNFAIKVYNELLKPAGDRVDFELSIDETQTPTDPSSHFFVAAQLEEAGVKVKSLAPRFCGEFQKGIDYIGDVACFEKEFKEHVRIAEKFGYKLSIHSGSDKFSVFPVIGRETKGRVHVKTAGTNWLEAVKVIIEADPALYRRIHVFALEHLEEAKKYYHIKADPRNIPDINTLRDEQLIELMNQEDARQVIHITYGLILQAREETGEYTFRDKIYACLHRNEELYARRLQEHIGKHLQTLGLS